MNTTASLIAGAPQPGPVDPTHRSPHSPTATGTFSADGGSLSGAWSRPAGGLSTTSIKRPNPKD